MRSVQQQAKHLLEKIEELRLGRHKVLILCGKPLSGKTLLAREACKQGNASYVDASIDLLPKITSPVLGAYGPDDLMKWIKDEASKGKILCVDEIEPLLATFGEQGARDFFHMLGSIEPKQVIIVVTRLEKPLKDAGFPANRVFCL
ncbi:MAG: ATP-binding protein [Chloroflexi bacterium]|nr:ATP-binding protein [Chloroflexota bacterium]